MGLLTRAAALGACRRRMFSSFDSITSLSREDATRIILQAKQNANLTFKDLSERLQVNKVWLVAAVHGQHPISGEHANHLIKTLNITGTQDQLQSLVKSVGQLPGSRADGRSSNDPAVRRLQEMLDVYGESFKTIIREEAGDGIMSAIDCTIHLDKVTVQSGANEEVRIVLNVNGKFLPYKVEHGKTD